MSDLLLWILIIATCQNLFSIFYAKIRIKWIERKMEKYEATYFTSEEKYYENQPNRMRLKRHFIYNGIFFSTLGAFVSNSVIEFIVSMIILTAQFFYMYHFFKKQKSSYYFSKKGVACVMLIHPSERQQVGFKKWKEIRYYNDSTEYLHLSGDSFKYDLRFDSTDGEKIRRIARTYTTYSQTELSME